MEFEKFKEQAFCDKNCYNDFVCHTLYNNYKEITERMMSDYQIENTNDCENEDIPKIDIKNADNDIKNMC